MDMCIPMCTAHAGVQAALRIEAMCPMLSMRRLWDGCRTCGQGTSMRAFRRCNMAISYIIIHIQRLGISTSTNASTSAPANRCVPLPGSAALAAMAVANGVGCL